MASKRSKYNTNCCVYGCHSRKGADRTLHFHYFPKQNCGIRVKIVNKLGTVEEVNKRTAWESVLHVGKLKGKPVTNSMCVCSKHFKEEDYCATGVTMKRPKLHPCAVPSLNLPEDVTISDQTRELCKSRQERLDKRQKGKECVNTSVGDVPLCEPHHNVESDEVESDEQVRTYADLTEDEKVAIQGLINIGNNQNYFVDKQVQVSSGDFLITFSSTIEKDCDLNSLTGISSFELLNSLTGLISQFYPDKKKHKLTVKDRIILVFMKLKIALNFNILSFLFKISNALTRAIFNEYVCYLSNILKPCIHWPSFEECQQNIPICFSNFQNVRVVLDCLEVPIEKPKCLCCRVRTYSHYKGRQTIKIMTGVSPAGLITFLSKTYGGRSSDKAIFTQSNLVYKLQPRRDSIMVDKGFLVDDVCSQNFIKIVRPHFLKKKKQFTEGEAKENVLISKARVHIERVNQRIRIFNILNAPVPGNIIPLIDDIMIIICGMVNLQKPVLSNCRF